MKVIVRSIYPVLLWLMAIIGPTNLCAQADPYIDSLKKAVAALPDDSTKVNLLWDISNYYFNRDNASGIQYGQQSLALAQQLSWLKGVGWAYFILGENYCFKSDLPMALDQHFKALKIFEELGNSELRAKGKVLDAIGRTYLRMNKFDKSLEYHLASLKLLITVQDSMLIATSYGNIANIYIIQDQPIAAIAYYNKSLKIFETMKDTKGISNTLLNIGNIYLTRKIYDSALIYSYKSLALFEGASMKESISINKGNIGQCYLEMYLQKPENKQYLSQAINYLKQSVDVSKEIGQLDNVYEFGKMLTDAYVQTNDYKNAFATLELFNSARDSLFNAENRVKVTAIETQRDLLLRERDMQIETLKAKNKKNERLIFVTGIALLLVVIGIVAYRLVKVLRTSKRLAKEKKKAMAHIEHQSTVLTEIAYTQSHDIRGPISTILGLLELYNYEQSTDQLNNELVSGIAEVTARLDKIVTEIVNKENKLMEEGKETLNTDETEE